MLCISIILIMYAMYLLFYGYGHEMSQGEHRWALTVLALAGAVGFMTRALAYAEVNYDFSPLEGKWEYSVKSCNK
jgi:hypothetical protein